MLRFRVEVLNVLANNTALIPVICVCERFPDQLAVLIFFVLVSHPKRVVQP